MADIWSSEAGHEPTEFLSSFESTNGCTGEAEVSGKQEVLLIASLDKVGTSQRRHAVAALTRDCRSVCTHWKCAFRADVRERLFHVGDVDGLGTVPVH